MRKFIFCILMSFAGTLHAIQPYQYESPKGTGPFPLIIFAHGCAGLSSNATRNWREWADWARANGYASAIVDSWDGRNLGNVCTQPGLANALLAIRVEDVYSVAEDISIKHNIDKNKIFLVGGSHGGRLAYEILTKNSVEQTKTQIKFAGAVGLYPGCSAYMYQAPTKSPLLMIVGSDDEWTIPQYCYNLARSAKFSNDEGYDIEIKTLEGAAHSFDYYWVDTVMWDVTGQSGKKGVKIGGTKDYRKHTENLILDFLNDIKSNKIQKRKITPPALEVKEPTIDVLREPTEDDVKNSKPVKKPK